MTDARPYTPREYQAIARRFLLDTPRCNLWAVPGMGKTSIAYSYMDILMLMGSGFFPALVIAPKKVCDLTWPAEQKKWADFAGIKVVKILGTPEERENAVLTKADVHIINYDNIEWLIEFKKRGKWPWRIVIADEARKLKNFRLRGGGKRAQALSEIAWSVGRWVNMTGTPATNGLVDLWGQNWFVDEGRRLGATYKDFMKRWFYENPFSKVIELRHPSCEAEIYGALADVSLALRAEDWFDIKEPLHFRREVELPPAARMQYDVMERDFFLQIGDREINAVNAAVLSGKLLQIASGAVYGAEKQVNHIHDAKIEELRSIIDELNEPLLVAYWFQFEVPMLKKAFPEFRVFRGADDEDAWNRGRIQLMGVHPQSAGHGVNLQYGGRAIATFTQTWDLELELQVKERIGPTRQMQAGLDRSVLHYDIVAKDTLDDVVLARRAKKQTILDALMAAHAQKA